MRSAFTYIIMGLVLWASPTFAQEVDGRGPYLMGPGDLVQVTVFRQDDLTIEARIQSDNTILVPVIGPITIGGLSEQDAALLIQTTLITGGVIRDAAVNLRILTFSSKQVSVLGFVTSPGAYFLERPSRISDVLAIAGGANTEGADYLVFTDFAGTGLPSVRTTIPISDLLGGEQAALDREVSDGDIIFVPKAPVFYMYGEVGRPGVFRLDYGMTIEQALASAGGVTELGNRNKIRRRDYVNGGKDGFSDVELTDAVVANDVFYIGRRLF